MNRTASSQNCARESAPPMLVFAQRKKTRMQFRLWFGSILYFKLLWIALRTRMVAVGW